MSASACAVMTPEIPDLPNWLKWVGSAAGGVVALVLFLRQWLSNAKVDRTADQANVDTIVRLNALLTQERARADELMREREGFITVIGELKGQVAVLVGKVEMLTNEVKRLREAS